MHLRLIYSPLVSGYRTQNCVMSLQKVLGQLRSEATTDYGTQYFKLLQVESDQLQLRLQFNIISVFSIPLTAQMS